MTKSQYYQPIHVLCVVNLSVKTKIHKHKILTGMSNSIIVFRMYSCCQISTSFTIIAYSMYYLVPVTSVLIQTDGLALSERTSELKQLLRVCHLLGYRVTLRIVTDTTLFIGYVLWHEVMLHVQLVYHTPTQHCIALYGLATDYFTRPSPTCPRPHHTTIIKQQLSHHLCPAALGTVLEIQGLGQTFVTAVSKIILKICFGPKNKLLLPPPPIQHYHPFPQPSF